MTLPPGFTGVTACLWKDPSLEEVYEVPQDSLGVAALLVPTVDTMITSSIVRDKAMGVTYMDTVTMSVGWVAISDPTGSLDSGFIIEDVTDFIE